MGQLHADDQQRLAEQQLAAQRPEQLAAQRLAELLPAPAPAPGAAELVLVVVAPAPAAAVGLVLFVAGPASWPAAMDGAPCLDAA